MKFIFQKYNYTTISIILLVYNFVIFTRFYIVIKLSGKNYRKQIIIMVFIDYCYLLIKLNTY